MYSLMYFQPCIINSWREMQHGLQSTQHILKLQDSFCTSKHPIRLRASESNGAVTEGIAAKTERATLTSEATPHHVTIQIYMMSIAKCP